MVFLKASGPCSAYRQGPFLIFLKITAIRKLFFMYNTNVSSITNSQKIFGTGLRMLESFTLFVKSVLHKKKYNNESFSYFLDFIENGSTILDIGAHNDDYLYQLLKLAKRARKLVTFESEPNIYNDLYQKKEVLKFKNVIVEQLIFSREKEEAHYSFSLLKKNSAAVIDFERGKSHGEAEAPASGMLDKYCRAHAIKPDVLRINSYGHELAILNGASELISIYKPKIFIECNKKYTSGSQILRTFAFLTGLKYSGYFILDTIKIPISNFDFDIYQNPLSNFYCKDFIFE